MMRIWIVDDDVTFAYGLKAKLKNSDRTIEVFTDSASFLKFFQKKKKENLPLPDLIFIEVELPDKTGPEIYIDFLKNQEALYKNFFFCSNISYGRFERFFEERQLIVPPFIQKSRLEPALEQIIQKFQPQPEKLEIKKKAVPVLPLPILKRYHQEIEETIKEIKDLYYISPIKTENWQKIQSLIEKLKRDLGQLNLQKLQGKISQALDIFSRKPKPGILRLKKEIKELLTLVEREMEDF